MKCPPGQDDASWDVDAAIEEELLHPRSDEVILDGGRNQEEPEAESDSKSNAQRAISRLRGSDIVYHRSSPRGSGTPVGIAKPHVKKKLSCPRQRSL